MKNIPGFLVFLLICVPLFAQDLSENCAEKAENYSIQVARAMLDGDDEALGRLLFAWEQECGLTEPVFRARTLQLIAAGQFPGSLENTSILEQAIAFEIRYRLIAEKSPAERADYYAFHKGFFGYVPIHEDFDRQTMRQAARLINRVSAGTIEYLMLEMYAGEPENFFAALRDGEFQETNLAAEYRNRRDELLRLPEFNVGIRAGMWFPMGDLDILGTHPSLGVNVGLKKGRNYFDAVFDFRFGKSARPVSVVLQDTLVKVSNFQGGYLGLEWSRVLVKGPDYNLEFFAGLGYDLIELVEDGQDPGRRSYGSFNFTLGPAYRHIFSNRTWLSLRPAFSFLNHDNPQGSSFNGNAWLFTISFGYSDNPRKSQGLRRLGYSRW
jgi:hypothetical protein